MLRSERHGQHVESIGTIGAIAIGEQIGTTMGASTGVMTRMIVAATVLEVTDAIIGTRAAATNRRSVVEASEATSTTMTGLTTGVAQRREQREGMNVDTSIPMSSESHAIRTIEPSARHTVLGHGHVLLDDRLCNRCRGGAPALVGYFTCYSGIVMHRGHSITMSRREIFKRSTSDCSLRASSFMFHQ